MNRREFIGSCAAGAVAVGLPAVQAAQYTEYRCRGVGPVTITVPAGTLMFYDLSREKVTATFEQDGKWIAVECDIVGRDSSGLIVSSPRIASQS